VNIKTVETITKIQVINTIGQIVLEKFNINNNFSSIELKTIESGVYTILVSTENGVIASKFIKQ
jgi:ribosomal protein S8